MSNDYIVPTVEVEFENPVTMGFYGYPSKHAEFRLERVDGRLVRTESTYGSDGVYMRAVVPSHPGRNGLTRWGSYELNCWFVRGAGDSWRKSAENLVRCLKRLYRGAGGKVTFKIFIPADWQ